MALAIGLLSLLDAVLNPEENCCNKFCYNTHHSETKGPREMIVVPMGHPITVVTHSSKDYHCDKPKEPRDEEVNVGQLQDIFLKIFTRTEDENTCEASAK